MTGGRRDRRGDLIGMLALWAAVAAALIVGGGAALSRFDVVSWDVGFSLMAIQIGRVAAVIALFVSLLALFRAFADFRTRGFVAVLATLISGALVVGIAHFTLTTRGAPPIHDVSTNWNDPVDVSNQLATMRGPAANPVQNDPRVPANAGAPWAGKRVAEVNAQTCPGAKPIMHGFEPDRAAQALQSAGVQVIGQDVERVEGVSTGAWFGVQDDVVVRLRPERTDVRAIRRQGAVDYGDNCKRVTRIIQALNAQAAK